jgi:cytochrome c oxidase assembly protein subunit 15
VPHRRETGYSVRAAGGIYHGCVPAEETARQPLGPAIVARTRHAAAVFTSPTPVTMRRTALAGVIAAAGIVATGAAVRLSASGLGCPDWPRCTRGSLVAAHTRGDPMVHTWVEFGNRLFTVVVMVVAIAVLVAAWQYRPDGGRRKDLTWLAAAQPLGVIAQALLGGLVVLTKLNPALVALHFLLSMAVLATAVVLLVRCTEGTGPARPLARADLRLLSWSMTAVTGVMLAAGTVVTGTGPLAGAGAVPRFHLPLTGVTQFHSDIGWLLGGLAVALAVGLRLSGAPPAAARLGAILLGLILLQGAVGYTQYFTGLPAGLVWFHVCGSVLIWIAALRLPFTLRDRGALATAPEVPVKEAVESARLPG